MVSIKSIVLPTHPQVCKFINENRMDQSQIVAITHSAGSYTLFYYA